MGWKVGLSHFSGLARRLGRCKSWPKQGHLVAERNRRCTYVYTILTRSRSSLPEENEPDHAYDSSVVCGILLLTPKQIEKTLALVFRFG